MFWYSRIHKNNKVTTQIILLFEIKYGWNALFIFLAEFLKIVLGWELLEHFAKIVEGSSRESCQPILHITFRGTVLQAYPVHFFVPGTLFGFKFIAKSFYLSLCYYPTCVIQYTWCPWTLWPPFVDLFLGLRRQYLTIWTHTTKWIFFVHLSVCVK